MAEIDDFEAELEDRFGALPAVTATCRSRGCRFWRGPQAFGHVGAGPKGVAMTLAPSDAEAAFGRLGSKLSVKLRGDRLVFPDAPKAGQLAAVEKLLSALA